MLNFFSKSSSSQNQHNTFSTTKWLLGAGVTTVTVVCSAVYALRNSYQLVKALTSLGVAGTSARAASSAIATSYFVPGREFRVNTYITGEQQNPSVASLSAGGFVVTWQSNGQDSSAWGIYGQGYDSAGNIQSNSFLVNTYTTDAQTSSSVTGLANGVFLVIWNSANQDGSGGSIYGQRYDSAGVRAGTEFRVNTYTTSYQNKSAAASLTDGGFVVVWDGQGLGGSATSQIDAQRYDSAGLTQGSQFRVNTYTMNDGNGRTSPSVAGLTIGGFVVTWQSYGQDGSDFGVYGQRYDSIGGSQDSEFRVNTYTTGYQGNPSVTALTAGGFVVMWEGVGQASDIYEIYGQRYDSGGFAIGSEFQVNTYTTDIQWGSSITVLSGGEFIATWQSARQDGSDYGIFAQRYDSAGNSQSTEFSVNTYTTSYQGNPSVAALTAGGFVVIWDGKGLSDDYGIYGKLCSNATCSLAPTTPTTVLYFLIGAGIIVAASSSAYAINRYLLYRRNHRHEEATRNPQHRHVNFTPSTKLAKKSGQVKTETLQISTLEQLNQLMQLSPALKEYVTGELEQETTDSSAAITSCLTFTSDELGDVVLVPLKNSQGVERTVALSAKLLDQAKRDYRLFNTSEMSDIQLLDLSDAPTIMTNSLAQSQWISGISIDTKRGYGKNRLVSENNPDAMETRSIGTTTSGVSIVRPINPDSEEDVDTIFASLVLPTTEDVELRSMKSGISSASAQSKVVRITTPEQLERILEIFPELTDALGDYTGQNPLFGLADSVDEIRSMGTMLSTVSGASKDSLVIRIKSDEDIEKILTIMPSACQKSMTSHLGNNSFFHPQKKSVGLIVSAVENNQHEQDTLATLSN